jgi:hypothetical protein
MEEKNFNITRNYDSTRPDSSPRPTQICGGHERLLCGGGHVRFLCGRAHVRLLCGRKLLDIVYVYEAEFTALKIMYTYLDLAWPLKVLDDDDGFEL